MLSRWYCSLSVMRRKGLIEIFSFCSTLSFCFATAFMLFFFLFGCFSFLLQCFSLPFLSSLGDTPTQFGHLQTVFSCNSVFRSACILYGHVFPHWSSLILSILSASHFIIFGAAFSAIVILWHLVSDYSVLDIWFCLVDTKTPLFVSIHMLPEHERAVRKRELKWLVDLPQINQANQGLEEGRNNSSRERKREIPKSRSGKGIGAIKRNRENKHSSKRNRRVAQRQREKQHLRKSKSGKAKTKRRKNTVSWCWNERGGRDSRQGSSKKERGEQRQQGRQEQKSLLPSFLARFLIQDRDWNTESKEKLCACLNHCEQVQVVELASQFFVSFYV